MAIALRTPGSWAAANATTQTVTLPTHAAGDMLIVRVGFKHATMPTTVTCGTAGWAKVATEVNGTGGASSNGGGGVEVCAFWKVATSAGETNPVITFHGGATAATPSAAVAMAYSKAAEETWETPVGDGAAVAAATSISATIASHVPATSGDLIDEFHVTNDNTTLTVPTFTQAGLTLAAVVESPAAALSSATSNDIAADGCYRIATAGTSSAAAVVTGTNSVADLGAAWTTRLRVNANQVATPGKASLSIASYAPVVNPRTTPPYLLPTTLVLAGSWGGTEVANVDDDPANPNDADYAFITASQASGLQYEFADPAYTITSDTNALVIRVRATVTENVLSGQIKIHALEKVGGTWTRKVSGSAFVPTGFDFWTNYTLSFSKSAFVDPDTNPLGVEIESIGDGDITDTIFISATDLYAPEGNANVVVTPSVATLTVSGLAPVVSAPRLTTPALATLTVSGLVPQIRRAVIALTAALSIATFAPTASVTNNQLVTPDATALTTSAFAPVVQSPRLVTTGVGSLSVATFAPAVSATENVRFVPTTQVLTATTLVPSVLTPRVVVPDVRSVSLVGLAPSVTASAHQTVIPALAALTTTGFAPAVARAVVPSTRSLTTSTFVPTALAPRVTTPPMTALTLSAFAPQIELSVSPSISALTINTFAPSVSTPRLAVPSTVALVVDELAPSVSATDHKTLVPDIRSLVLGSLQPAVEATQNRLAKPDLIALTITSFSPAVSTSDALVVVPATKTVALSTFAATVSVTAHQTVTPTQATLSTSGLAPVMQLSVVVPASSITLTPFVPTVTAAQDTTVVPGVAALAASTLAPSVSATDNRRAVPSAAALSVATFAPAISATQNKWATPDRISLTVGVFAPTVTAANAVTVVPDTRSLIKTDLAPVVSVSDFKVVTPGTVSVITAGLPPTVLAPRGVVVGRAALSSVGHAPLVLASGLVEVLSGELHTNMFAPAATIRPHNVPETAELLPAPQPYARAIGVDDVGGSADTRFGPKAVLN